ncbi:hypothetical protein [Micromonospora sp. SH-82]|uniref:hypothetical protein n=1 Tax=Micromonospora sp. SH-82 TaxID=3132938 RepID=UPI003EBAECA2
MTAPFRSAAQIRNRLILSARWILRDHRPAPDGRCPVCRVSDCPTATAARDYEDLLVELKREDGR